MACEVQRCWSDEDCSAEHGYCIDGQCQCKEGFAGELCEVVQEAS